MTAPSRIQPVKYTEHDMVNAGEHCRACKGKGGVREETYTGGYVFEPCFWCRGTGCQTVRVGGPQ